MDTLYIISMVIYLLVLFINILFNKYKTNLVTFIIFFIYMISITCIYYYTTGRKSCPGIKEVEYAISHN